MSYVIKRSYRDGREPEVIQRGVTLEEAQKHCRDPKTREPGVWFDFFDIDTEEDDDAEV